MDKLLIFLSELKYPYFIKSYTTETDPNIKHFIYILGISSGRLVEVEDEILELAIFIYQNDPLPFFISALNMENTKKILGGEYNVQ